MGHSNGKITAPVNTDDISAVIGVNSHDVATLCRSANVNPDSLAKPIRLTVPGSKPFSGYNNQGDFNNPVKDSLTESMYLAGYKIPYMNLVQGFTWTRFIDRFLYRKWEFQALDYGCMDHFVNYNHNAKFEDAAWPIIRCNFTIGQPITFTVFCPDSTKRFVVSPFNMPFFKDMYLGIALFKMVSNGTGGNTWEIVDAKTNTTKICPYEKNEDGSWPDPGGKKVGSLSFENCKANTTYYALPFISEGTVTGYANMYNGLMAYCASYKPPVQGQPVPSGGMVVIGAAANTVSATCSATFLTGQMGSNALNFTIKLTNTWTQQVTVKGKIIIKEYNQQGTSIIASYETMENVAGVAVPAKSGSTNGTKQYTEPFSIPSSPWYTISYQFIGTYTVGDNTYTVQSTVAYLNANGTSTAPSGAL